jgi:hypothetical protein
MEGENVRLSTEYRRIRKENAELLLALHEIGELSESKSDPRRLLAEINQVAINAIEYQGET